MFKELQSVAHTPQRLLGMVSGAAIRCGPSIACDINHDGEREEGVRDGDGDGDDDQVALPSATLRLAAHGDVDPPLNHAHHQTRVEEDEEAVWQPSGDGKGSPGLGLLVGKLHQ